MTSMIESQFNAFLVGAHVEMFTTSPAVFQHVSVSPSALRIRHGRTSHRNMIEMVGQGV